MVSVMRKGFGLVLLFALCGQVWSATAKPVVSLTAPASGATFTAGANIVLSASASESGGTISKVDFYRGGTILIGTATTSPYTVTWSNAAAGAYSLTAKATDSKGGTTTSTAVSISVVAPQPPTVTLTAPGNGSSFVTGSTITLSANASAPSGTVASVAFYNGAILIGTSTSAPYSVTWTNVVAGTYALTAKATDNKGATGTSSAVTISVINPPLVVVTSPVTCGATYAPTTLVIKADAASQQSSIAKVDFFQSATLLGTSTASPYSYTWSNVGAGKYAITARATDTNGISTISRPVTFTVVNDVAPTVSIASPQSGAVFQAGTPISISASAAASAQSAIAKVDFYAGGSLIGTATAVPYTISWNPYAVGTFSITAVATDNLGLASTSAPVQISTVSDNPPSVSITAPGNGTAYGVGATIHVTATASDSDGTVSKVDFYVDGTAFGSVAAAPYAVNWTASTAGTHALTAIATDNLGLTTTSAVVNVSISADSPPTVSISAPTASTQFAAGTAVPIVVNAASATSTIARVDFYANASSIGTVTNAPYSLNWNGAATGTYTLTAIATDSLQLSATSAPVQVSVIVDNPPAVSIASPANGTAFNAGVAVPITATATDSDGNVSKVDFFVNGAKIGSATAAPYSVSWNGSATAGNFALTAVATDNLGLATTSAPVQVTINPNQPPTVSITNPPDGISVPIGGSIAIGATAADADGTVARVDFYANATSIGTAYASPYSVTFNASALGSVTVSAIATDNLGATTTSAPIHLTAIQDSLPTISLTEPSAGKTFSAGASVSLGAVASSTDSSIARVDFYADGALIGSATAKPYVVTWSNVPAGSHQLTAKATDSLGASGTCAPVSVSVIGPQLTVNSPPSGTTVNANTVLVSGTMVAPANSGVIVNGTSATLDDNNNFYAKVQLRAGSNTINVVLTTPDGYTTNQTLTVNNNATPVISVTADPIEGVAPLTVNFTVTNLSATSVTVQANGSAWGTLQPGTSGGSPWSFSTGVGAVPATFTATDGSGITTTVSLVIVLHDPAALDRRFQAVFNEMNNALIAGDKASAMTMLNYSAQVKYGPVFDILMPNYAPIAASASALQRSTYTATYSEYAVNRMLDGVNQVYLVYFLPDANGIWRLDSM